MFTIITLRFYGLTGLNKSITIQIGRVLKVHPSWADAFRSSGAGYSICTYLILWFIKPDLGVTQDGSAKREKENTSTRRSRPMVPTLFVLQTVFYTPEEVLLSVIA